MDIYRDKHPTMRMSGYVNDYRSCDVWKTGASSTDAVAVLLSDNDLLLSIIVASGTTAKDRQLDAYFYRQFLSDCRPWEIWKTGASSTDVDIHCFWNNSSLSIDVASGTPANERQLESYYGPDVSDLYYRQAYEEDFLRNTREGEGHDTITTAVDNRKLPEYEMAKCSPTSMWENIDTHVTFQQYLHAVCFIKSKQIFVVSKSKRIISGKELLKCMQVRDMRYVNSLYSKPIQKIADKGLVLHFLAIDIDRMNELVFTTPISKIMLKIFARDYITGINKKNKKHLHFLNLTYLDNHLTEASNYLVNNIISGDTVVKKKRITINNRTKTGRKNTVQKFRSLSIDKNPKTSFKQEYFKENNNVLYVSEISLSYTSDGQKPSTKTKSSARKIILNTWPCYEIPKMIDCVIIDVMSWFFKTPPVSLKSLPSYIKWFVTKFIKPYIDNHCKCVVLVLDKPVFSSPVKNCINRVTKKIDIDKIHLTKPNSSSDSSEPINVPEWEWDKNNLYQSIYSFFEELLRHPDDYLPKGRYTFIVDGYTKLTKTSEDASPISLSRSGEGPVMVCNMPQYSNMHAEADQAVFSHLNLHSLKYNHFLIVSVDSDLTLIGLWHYDYFVQRNGAIKIWIDDQTKPDPYRFISLNILADKIKMDPRLHGCNFLLKTLVTCFAMIGCNDYNGGINGFSPDDAFTVLTEVFRKDLVFQDKAHSDTDWGFKQYKIFLKTLFLVKFKKLFTECVFPISSDPAKWTVKDMKLFLKAENITPAKDKTKIVKQMESVFNTNPSLLQSVDGVQPTLKKPYTPITFPEDLLRSKLENKNPMDWYPRDDPMIQHYKRTEYCLRIWQESIKLVPDIPSGEDLLNWGYTKPDGAMPLSESNIMCDFGNNSTPLV